MIPISSVSRCTAVVILSMVACVIPLIILAHMSLASGAPVVVVIPDAAQSIEDDPKAAPVVGPNLNPLPLPNPPSTADAEPISPDDTEDTKQDAASTTTGHESYTMDVGTFVLVKVRNSNRFRTYNKTTGQWRKHQFAKGVKAVPIVSTSSRSQSGIAAFAGGDMSELVAIDAQGEFRTHKLEQPIPRTPLEGPFVGNEMLYFVVSGTVHAFSGRTSAWGSLKAPHLSNLQPGDEMNWPVINGGTLIVEFDDRISAFSVQSGKWSTDRFDDAPK